MADNSFFFKGAWVRRIEFSLVCPKCGKSFENTGYMSDKSAIVACSDMCEGRGNLYGVDVGQWLYHQRAERDYYKAVDREMMDKYSEDDTD